MIVFQAVVLNSIGKYFQITKRQKLLEACYDSSIEHPKLLNKYKPFSSSMYGEMSFELIEKMINQLPIIDTDVFLDLGSGVGNVVLHMASCGYTLKECIGIEHEKIPAK